MTDAGATVDAPAPDRDDRRTIWMIVAVGVVITLSGLHFLANGEVVPGNDMTGHLQRNEWGIEELFLEGRLDGWFPGLMLGYQLFLFYGPGLTVLVALADLLTLGTVSDAGALKMVMVAGLIATPIVTLRFARAFGLRPFVAGAAGILSLAAGSTRGGGIDGTFATGLAAQQVGLPLAVFALALVTEAVSRASPPRRTGPLPLAFTVAALALTHPLSLLLTAMLTPICLGAVAVQGTFDRAGIRRLLTSAAWAIGLSAWWWLPAMIGSDLRGPTSSFTLPGVWEHVELLVTGDRGWRGIVGPIATLAVAAALVDGVVARDRRLLALALLPVTSFGLLHLTHGLLGIYSDVGRQLPNRGLVLVAVVATPAAAAGIDAWVQRAPGSLRRRIPGAHDGSVTWTVLCGLTLWSVLSLDIGPVDRYRPEPVLFEAADILGDEVPDSARYGWIDGDSGDLGVPEPQRWLTWKSGRNSQTPFVIETAPGASAVGFVSRGPIDAGDAGRWIARTRRLGITHVATGNSVKAAMLAGHRDLTPLLEHDSLVIWRIEARPGAPTGSIVPASAARIVDHDGDTYVIDITVDRSMGEPTPLALGYSPGWSASIDGENVDVTRSNDDRVAIVLPEGDHRVALRFDEEPPGPVGRAIATATLVLAGGRTFRRRQARRNTRSEPVAETGSKSPEMARR